MIQAFLMVSTSSITMQSLGKIIQCALAVGAKIWCSSLCFFCLSCSEARVLFVRGGHSSNKYYMTLYGSILMRFSSFFLEGSAFQRQYMILIFDAIWCHKFQEMAVKNCEKSKNRWKSLCAPLRIDS